MTDQTKIVKPSDNTSDGVVRKPADRAGDDGIVSTHSNQIVFKDAFETTHKHDIDPSDPRLMAAQTGESPEQFKARLEANKFAIVDPAVQQILETGNLEAIRGNEFLPADRKVLASHYQEMRRVAKQTGYGTELIDRMALEEFAAEIRENVRTDVRGVEQAGTFRAVSNSQSIDDMAHNGIDKHELPPDMVQANSVSLENSTLLADGKVHSDFNKQAEKNIEKVSPDDKQTSKIPKDGETVTLKQLLEEYKTPFIDAWRHSQALEQGKGKSPTLEAIMFRLNNCPWTDKIKIKFDQHVQNTEYDALSSTITIHPNDPPAKQIQTFAHEAFHATHQYLARLHLSGEPDGRRTGDDGKPLKDGEVSKSTYLRIRTEGELGSFIAEINIYREITKGEPGSGVYFDYEFWGQHQKDLEKLYGPKNDKAALEKFILDAQPIGAPETYRQHYEKSYSASGGYKAEFDVVKKGLEELIQDWDKRTSHSRKQFIDWDY